MKLQGSQLKPGINSKHNTYSKDGKPLTQQDVLNIINDPNR